MTDAVAVWEEPVRGGYPEIGLFGLSGRERLEVWRRNAAPPPPLFHLTGARPTGFSDGTAEAEMPVSGWLAVSSGLVTGGTLAIVADIAFGCAVETKLPAATPYATAEMSLSFLRPVPPRGTLFAGGQAIHVGRSVGLSEAFLIDPESDRLVAHGTSRLSIFPRLDPVPEYPASEPYEPPKYETPDPYMRPPPEGIIHQELWAEVPGLEVLRRQMRGELPPPPLHHLTGIEPTEVGGGAATVRMPATEWLNQPARRLQGGTIAMLADFAMLTAVQTTADAGVAFAGLDLKANYLHPVTGDGRDLTARAEVIHRGRTLAITRAEVSNADGQPVLLATGSSMYLPGRPASLGEIELVAEETEANASQ
jgi:uncharacterized protein (TIGR00369 family)